MTADGILLREGNSADIEAVMRVMAAAFDRAYGEAWTAGQCQGVLGLPGIWLTIAYDEDLAIGFALGRAVLDEAELLLLGVDPAYRRRGIGAALLERTLGLAATLKAERLHLEVRAGNGAVGLYRRYGFDQVGQRKNYYRGGDGQLYDALSLSCSLRIRDVD